MTSYKGSEFYLNNGRLDLSSLNKDVQEDEKENHQSQIKDSELADLQNGSISVTLEEMASMFDGGPKEDSEDEFEKAFNPDRLKEEMKEFGIDK